jgi:mannan endo-1,4-beta-mannosidase
MDAFFGALRPNGLTRAWAFETQGTAGLDRMIHFAEVHGQMLILSLGNSHDDCGDQDGVPAGAHSKAPAWYAGGYTTHYLAWVQSVVTRYQNSAAIGMWEILNEPGAAAGGPISDATMRAFFDHAAKTIKTIDPVHLVESGAQAEYVAGTTDYAYVHGGPDVDVGSLHEYDYDYNNGHTIVSPHFMPTLSGMKMINKPLIIGEIGVKANDGTACTDRVTRRSVFKQKFDAYLQQGAAAALVWNWSPLKHDNCIYETLYPADPTMTLLHDY